MRSERTYTRMDQGGGRGVKHAVTRARGWRGGKRTRRSYLTVQASRRSTRSQSISGYQRQVSRPMYRFWGGRGSTSDNYQYTRPMYGDVLLRGLGLRAVGELILLLVSAPTAIPTLVLIGAPASDGHEPRSRRDSLPRLGGECPSTRLQGGGARGTTALWRGASATDRASSWY